MHVFFFFLGGGVNDGIWKVRWDSRLGEEGLLFSGPILLDWMLLQEGCSAD